MTDKGIKISELSVIVASLFFYYLTDQFKKNASTDELFKSMSLYSLIFLGLVAVIFVLGEKLSPRLLLMSIPLSFIIRLPLLSTLPVASTDLHRNLMFGHLLSNNLNPYLYTGQDILSLIQVGKLSLIIPYTPSWDTHSYDYPSMTILFFSFIIWSHNSLFGDPFFYAKTILTISNFLIAFTVYRIIRDYTSWSESFAIRVSVIYLFNPISVYQVSLEGQFESIPTLFTLLAILYTLKARDVWNDKNKESQKHASFYAYLAGFFIGMGFLFKYYPIILFPLLLIYLTKVKLILKAFFAFLISVYYLSIPFIFSSAYITNFLEYQSQREDTESISHAVNSFGIQVGFNTLSLFFFVGAAIIALIRKNKQGVLINLSAYTLFFFVISGSSLFPWYLIMVFPATLLARAEIYEYSHVFSWLLVVLFFQIIWFSEPAHISTAIIIVAIGGIIAFLRLFSKETKEKEKVRKTRPDLRSPSLIKRFYFKFEENSKFEILLVLFSIAGLLAPFTGMDHDMNVWLSVGQELVTDHTNPYQTGLVQTEYYAYPPPWMFVIQFFYWLSQKLGFESTIYLSRFFIKLPLILAIALTAYFIDSYLASKKVSDKKRKIIFIFISLNPLIIVISAMWGMFDILPALFTILAVIYLMKSIEDKENLSLPVLSGFFMAIASLFKLYPIIIAPVLFLSLPSIRSKIIYSLSFTLTVIITILPFLILDSEAFLFIFEYHSSRMGGGLTFWNGAWILIVKNQITEDEAGQMINLIAISLNLFFLILIYSLVYLKKFHEDPLTPSLIVALLFFASFKIVYETYVVWLIPLLALWIGLSNIHQKKQKQREISVVQFTIMGLVT
ncbi:MAG: glycosyltransferase family 39 protein, partial [Candidatus Heimdallarchaeota archaeon]|nr:glycosyltransferase family 39 protein [Candidatus Heimdallarchaeota archaeon]MCK5049390.1 glycosyltransferase family 39 protein [Candidatus Heimdallarchaeota archaeon]